MQAMVEALITEQVSEAPSLTSGSRVHFLHACENSAQHSFNKRLVSLSEQGKINALTWYKSEAHREVLDATGIYQGYMDLAAVKNRLPLALADFYLCGPVGFMQFAKQQLVDLGVSNDRIHYEVFGPHESF
jgi:nitric oxide dioxygenase